MAALGRTIVAGGLAGLVGTLAMDLVWYARHRAQGGGASFTEWNIATTDSFEEAAAPAQVGKRIADTLRVDLPEEAAGTTTNVVHWLTGVGYGVGHGLLRNGHGTVTAGLATGAGAFGNSYATLGAAGIYQPIWRYDVDTLRKDLTAHLAYGLVTSAAFRLLSAADTDASSPRHRTVGAHRPRR